MSIVAGAIGIGRRGIREVTVILPRNGGRHVQCLVILQSGSYAEAWTRLRDGGPETYRDQRWSVDFVESVSSDFSVTTVSTSTPHSKVALKQNLSSMGVSPASAWDGRTVPRLLTELRPDLLLMRVPFRDAVSWAVRAKVRTLPTFANMFYTRNLRERYRLWRLGVGSLDAPCVCNHSLNASRSMQKLRIPKERIIPWEFRRIEAESVAKESRSAGPLRIFFAGVVSESKGVGDCIDACALLSDRGVSASLTVAGPGDVPAAQDRAARAGVAARVRFLGPVASDEVRAMMRDHDVVVVPSRHDFAEGIPNTIYEALASRTPLVASDHPSWAGRLAAGDGSLQFRAADASSLSEQLQRLVEDQELYRQLSNGSEALLDSLYVGIEWTDLVRRFLNDPENGTGWVEPISLRSVESRIDRRR